MATPKHATIISSQPSGQSSQALTVSYRADDFDSFVGGKFIIVDTGLRTPDDKALKRAYSLFDVDIEKKQFSLVVKNLEGTPGAEYMLALAPENEITFSGPWGKFVSVADKNSPVWLIATDTGFTACHGWLSSSQQKENVNFFWLREADNYFNEDSSSDLPYEAVTVVPVSTAGRAESCWQKLSEQVAGRDFPERVFLSGDGEVLLHFKEQFLAQGLLEENIYLEMFFNNPAKKST